MKKKLNGKKKRGISTATRSRSGDFYTTVRIDEDIRERTRKYCKRSGATMAGTVNAALRQFLDDYEAKMSAEKTPGQEQ